jgi:23S rRNA pseudouridine1911/1915/1917 synthase
MVVHPAVKNMSGTLVNALLYNIKDLSGINGVVRPGIVHRLDKDTSGLIVIAKNDFAHVEISKQISTKECKRIYRAVVEGNLKQEQGEVITYIDRSKKNRLKMAVSDSGKIAHTLYKVLGHYNKFDYVEFELKTGRTHQIRVHCEHLHHPIVGDKLYGSKTEKCHKFGQFLHAYKLILTHPRTGETMEFNAPIPQYFQEFLEKLN